MGEGVAGKLTQEMRGGRKHEDYARDGEMGQARLSI